MHVQPNRESVRRQRIGPLRQLSARPRLEFRCLRRIDGVDLREDDADRTTPLEPSQIIGVARHGGQRLDDRHPRRGKLLALLIAHGDDQQHERPIQAIHALPLLDQHALEQLFADNERAARFALYSHRTARRQVRAPDRRGFCLHISSSTFQSGV